MIRKQFCNGLFGLVLGAFVLMPTLVHAEKFDVSQGTRQAFGGVTVNYGTPMVPAPLSTYSNANWSGSLLLSLGYFVIDDLAVLISAVGSTSFTSTANANIALGLGAMYVFENRSPIFPYLQASFTAGWAPGGPAVPQFWSLGIAPQVGFLAGLNKNVALDVAVQANIGWPIGQTGPAAGAWISSAIGLIGARISI